MPYKDQVRQRTAQVQYQTRKKQKCRELVAAFKRMPCQDCGIQYPSYVMQFDHVSGKKIDSICYLSNHGFMKKLLTEIQKCEIVCANCHAVRTHVRSAGVGKLANPAGLDPAAQKA